MSAVDPHAKTTFAASALEARNGVIEERALGEVDRRLGETDLTHLPSATATKDDVNLKGPSPADPAKRLALYQEGHRLEKQTASKEKVTVSGSEITYADHLNKENSVHKLVGEKKGAEQKGMLITGNATITTDPDKKKTWVDFGGGDRRDYDYIPDYIAVNGKSKVTVEGGIPVLSAGKSDQSITLKGDKPVLVAMGSGKTNVNFANATNARVDGRQSAGLVLNGTTTGGAILGSNKGKDEGRLSGLGNVVSLGGGEDGVTFSNPSGNFRSVSIPKGEPNVTLVPSQFLVDAEIEALQFTRSDAFKALRTHRNPDSEVVREAIVTFRGASSEARKEILRQLFPKKTDARPVGEYQKDYAAANRLLRDGDLSEGEKSVILGSMAKSFASAKSGKDLAGYFRDKVVNPLSEQKGGSPVVTIPALLALRDLATLGDKAPKPEDIFKGVSVDKLKKLEAYLNTLKGNADYTLSREDISKLLTQVEARVEAETKKANEPS